MPSSINGTAYGTSGDDTFNGTAGNDSINMIGAGPSGHDVAFGGAGNDRIISDGDDVIYGGQGGIDIADLRLQTSTANFVIDIADELTKTDFPGDNALYDIGDHRTFIGSIEQLFFAGGSGNDLIKGGAYSDRLDGGSGADSLYGGGGADQLFGHNGTVTLDGGMGADTITIDGYVQHVNGGTDLNSNGSVNYGVIDRLNIVGTAGYDAAGHVGDITNVEQIWVNAGLAPITFSQNDDPQTVTWLNGGAGPTTTYGHQIYVTDVGNGSGGFLGAVITGSEYGDSIRGGQGDDHLIGNKGGDTLAGGAGADTLEGGIGGDKIYGGDGNDRIIVLSGPSQQPDTLIDGGAGDDTLFYNATLYNTSANLDITQPSSTVAGTTVTSIEILNYQGSTVADTVHGGALNDSLGGGGGDDFLFGGLGHNQLVGGDGDDTAVFVGNASDFTFAHNGAFITATNLVTGEIDDLKTIEHVSFNNGADSGHLLSDYIV